MRHGTCRLLALGLVAAALTGCTASSVNINGREIRGQGGLFVATHAHSSGTGAFIVFGSKTVHVSQKQICWDDGMFDLPENWKHVDLKEGFSDMKVVVDGKEVTKFKF